jgi:hypothetical protein
VTTEDVEPLVGHPAGVRGVLFGGELLSESLVEYWLHGALLPLLTRQAADQLTIKPLVLDV